MSALLQVPLATVDQYFAEELASPVRHEYYRGQIMAMAGASIRHNAIGMNIGGELRTRLRGKGCLVLGSDSRLAADPDTHYTYPDITVTCAKPILVSGRPDTITNPTVIVEVLSPSTERFDRGRKFEDCRRLASLREYVLVSQFKPQVEVFQRGEAGRWVMREFSGMEAVAPLESLGVELPLAEIYLGVDFSSESPVEP